MISSATLYPGSFVHVTPSFIIPTVVYADSHRRAAQFFADPDALEMVRRKREYGQEPEMRFHPGNYATAIDLLVSQYAGFIPRV